MMKLRFLSFALILLLASCAGMGSSNTKRLLSASGFQTRTPQNSEQTAIYEQMEPYKLYNKEIRGKMLYAYKDPEQGVVYIGGPEEHAKYQQFAVQQEIAADQRMAAEMQMEAAYRWNSWGPYRPWWY